MLIFCNRNVIDGNKLENGNKKLGQCRSFEELTHWKRPWCWEGLGAGGEGDNRVWHGWMASPTRWAWVWVNSGSLWWTGRSGVLRFMGWQRVGHDWAAEVNWEVFDVVGIPSVAASTHGCAVPTHSASWLLLAFLAFSSVLCSIITLEDPWLKILKPKILIF